MQEVMVKSEALLKKVGEQANLKEKIKDFVSRKELDQLRAMKVDKLEFDQQLQSAVSNSRKVRKFAALENGLPPVIDGALQGDGRNFSQPQVDTIRMSSGGPSSTVMSTF
jgi:hypothetical protein